MGKTRTAFFRDEQATREPFQPGLFDDLIATADPLSTRSEQREQLAFDQRVPFVGVVSDSGPQQ